MLQTAEENHIFSNTLISKYMEKLKSLKCRAVCQADVRKMTQLTQPKCWRSTGPETASVTS